MRDLPASCLGGWFPWSGRSSRQVAFWLVLTAGRLLVAQSLERLALFLVLPRRPVRALRAVLRQAVLLRSRHALQWPARAPWPVRLLVPLRPAQARHYVRALLLGLVVFLQ